MNIKQINNLKTGSLAAWLLTLFVFITVNFHAPIARAQSVNVDFEVPEISTEQTSGGVQGQRQVVEAIATDNRAIKEVQLFYRFRGDSEYTEVLMQQRGTSSVYFSEIPTVGINATELQYYLRAEDTSGNSVLRGFSFAPLVWSLVSDPSDSPETVPETETETQPVTPSGKTSTVLYYVLGVLAVGAVAAIAARGGGSSTSTPENECGVNGCLITITTPSFGN